MDSILAALKHNKFLFVGAFFWKGTDYFYEDERRKVIVSIQLKWLINLRANPHMPDIMIKMFDYDLEVSDLEKEFFMVKEKIEPIFNFIDVSYQLLDVPFEKTVALLNKQMGKLRNYYNRKATLNMAQSESIVDLFRFCARKDSVLSKALNGDLL